MFYPIVGKRSLGSRIWDVDGNEYIDLLMGFGVNLFGHNPPFVKAALEAQLDQGIQIGPNAELAGVVAQLICELTGMERVTFSNTGTEAVMTALRLARKATGRNKIALFSNSYHGHFDGTLARAAGDNPQGVPSDLGVIPNFVADVLVLDYGNFQSLEIIKAHKHELAAVLVEPVQTRRPDLQPFEFLKQLRDLTKESAIALIFDEMVTGFRVHPGGAQAVFGIEADIATYGKVVGGGMPIGIVAGKPAYMDGIDGGMWNYGDDSSPQTKTTFFAGTYCKHPLSMAAARAVLLHLKSQGPKLQEQLNQRTSDFVARLNAFFQSAHLPMQFANFGSYFGSVPFGNSAQTGSSAVSDSLNFLNYHLLDKGIFIRGGDGFISTAHTDEDINYILQSVQDSVEDLRRGCFL
jgi:glutamate-1-semialdehyde aminotransferase